LISGKRICELIDEMLNSGVTSSSAISEILERDNGIGVPPYFIAEYKYRKRFNLGIRGDFFDFEKEKQEGAKTVP
jgi:hypothetical protein